MTHQKTNMNNSTDHNSLKRSTYSSRNKKTNKNKRAQSFRIERPPLLGSPSETSFKKILLYLNTLSLQDLKKNYSSKWPDLNLRFCKDKKFALLNVAWRIQAEAYGSLSERLQEKIRNLTSTYEREADKKQGDTFGIKPGTRLIREWRGELHEVIYLDTSFLYRGKRFHSLSEVASRITGTRWSGPNFFGLRERKLPHKSKVNAHA